MTAAPVLVEASLPQACDVCVGDGRTEVGYPDVPGLTLVTGCAHCFFRLPIHHYPREAR